LSALDLIGVGFGPSNLALAIALEEQPSRRIRPLFFERAPRFTWHGGMLIEDATMQISFLKDLVTLRNPRSCYSFLSYLQARERLVDFVNRKDFFPTRREFHDYLEWVAASFSQIVRYGQTVHTVLPVRRGRKVDAFDVVTVDGSSQEEVHRTRNLVVASGLRPRLPSDVRTSPRVWHSSQLLHRLEQWPTSDARAFAVVGAGQSAAEVVAHLHDRFASAQVFAVLPRYGFSAADNSPFANRIFDPAAVDDFFDAPPETKRRFYEYHRNANYSAVDARLIEDLYRRAYEESVRGESRLHVVKMSEVAVLDEDSDGVRLLVRSLIDGTTTDLGVDAVVMATGYDPMDPTAVLGPVADLCERDADGLLRVRRDYRLETAPEVTARIYVQGGTEHTHGISSSLLSNTGLRAWEIAESVAEESADDLRLPDTAGFGLTDVRSR
jgi:L-ornithine N5-oxygenase